MDIIKRNFLQLIMAGAFGEPANVEPMSRYKWDILFHVAYIHNVVDFINKGIYSNKCNIDAIPKDIIIKYKDTTQNLPDAGLSHMCNRILNSRLQKIREKEPSAEDSSIETLNMLDIIVQASENIMTYGLSFANILKIGIYLRTDGDKVDFIKLEKWLHKLNISRMAHLEGSILISIFDFQNEEIPFVERIEPSAAKFAIQALEKPIHIDVEEWKISQKSTIFIANNSKAMMKTVNNCLRYFFFSPIEATSNFLHRFVYSLSNLEE